MAFNGAQIAVTTDTDLESGEKDVHNGPQQSSEDSFPLGVQANEVPPLFAYLMKFMGWNDLMMAPKQHHSKAWPVISATLYYLTMIGSFLQLGIAIYQITGSVEISAATSGFTICQMAFLQKMRC